MKTDPGQLLNRIMTACAESVADATDEELLKGASADERQRSRETFERALRKAKESTGERELRSVITRALDLLVDSPRDLPSLTLAVSSAVQVLVDGLR